MLSPVLLSNGTAIAAPNDDENESLHVLMIARSVPVAEISITHAA